MKEPTWGARAASGPLDLEYLKRAQRVDLCNFARTLLTADTTHPHAHDDDDNGFGATVSPLRSRRHQIRDRLS